MATRKQKRADKVKAKQRKIAQRHKKRSERAALALGQTRFRLLAFQPLSLTFEDPRPFELFIQSIPCRFFLRPAQTDEKAQRTHGGMFIVVDFFLTGETDLLLATNKGLDLVDDFFSGVSLVEGTTFGDVEPVEIIRADLAAPGFYNFIHFSDIPLKHWHKPISSTTMDSVRGLLAHWDGLDSGQRLRRAARQFHKAIGIDNAIAAFQQAYIGLEALEKPLAEAIGVPPGVEIIQGKCEKCGAEFTRRRTVLAGVRAYISGEVHPGIGTPERMEEWRDINRLRQKSFHSLEGSTELDQELIKVLPAAMHYLHDAICCLSHEHTLESREFKLARGARRFVLAGRFRSAGLDSIDQWRPIIEVKDTYWVHHPQHGSVPEIHFSNHKEIEAAVFWIDAPLKSALENHLVPANFEQK